MKYIRTKDELGICVEYDGEYKDLNKGTYFKTWRGVYIHEDWEVADTIKELCDEFVVEADELGINKHHSHSIDETLKDAKQSAKIYKENYNKKQIIYGAIWTNKGLIYVAKMNEKGELELL